MSRQHHILLSGLVFQVALPYRDATMKLHGKNLIAGERVSSTGHTFQCKSPLDGTALPGDFAHASEDETASALIAAGSDFPSFAATSAETRALFLETIAQNILDLGDALLERCHAECGLPMARLQGERGRTVGQLRLFAQVAREDSWRDPRIDTAQPDRQPLPKPDLRRAHVPLGPVVVFGASNFPLAFSVAGGDTASAFATGNPVVVKAHDSHPGTSELVGEAILAAINSLGLPSGVFSMLHGPGRKLGPILAKHPATKAVALTGSLTAGRALFDASASRPDPIPVFAEMSSLNPFIVLPSALAKRGAAIATQLVGSITLGVGQFCTKPGIVFVHTGEGYEEFKTALAAAAAAVPPATMLHSGICDSFTRGSKSLLDLPGIEVLGKASAAPDAVKNEGAAVVVRVTAETFLSTPHLREEYFGPLGIVIETPDEETLLRCLSILGGQLSITFHGENADFSNASSIVDAATRMAGRIVFNSVPTGVEVCPSMQHGGPWPAASDARFTSVGTAALVRFTRPVAWQGSPESLLPEVLRDANPRGLIRLVNGVPTSAPVS
ncbi:MAG: aldehyde dehydrogenase (NADP(+)) [Verrucomicrobiales bacterium]